MQPKTYSSRWLIAPALLLAYCSQGPSPSLTRPSTISTPVAAVDQGDVGASAVGDVKVGPGALDIERLRMDRQDAAGASILRQYANPGQTYAINPGERIELWAEWNFSVVPGNPRFRVEWGDGSDDIINCGPCLLTHRYSRLGTYVVRASLDDRVSTTVTRTFFLNAAEAVPELRSFVYSQAFVANQSYSAGSPQFDSWTSFNASLNTGVHSFSRVSFSGSNAPTVFTCSNPVVVAQIANALRGNTPFNGSCDGHSWAVANCNAGPALGVDNPACSSCADLNAIRPHIGNANWGGFNSPSCNSGPSQTLTLAFLGMP